MIGATLATTPQTVQVPLFLPARCFAPPLFFYVSLEGSATFGEWNHSDEYENCNAYFFPPGGHSGAGAEVQRGQASNITVRPTSWQCHVAAVIERQLEAVPLPRSRLQVADEVIVVVRFEVTVVTTSRFAGCLRLPFRQPRLCFSSLPYLFDIVVYWCWFPCWLHFSAHHGQLIGDLWFRIVICAFSGTRIRESGYGSAWWPEKCIREQIQRSFDQVSIQVLTIVGFRLRMSIRCY